MPQIAKALIFTGLLLVAVGILFFIGSKIPFFGKLPGDIYIQRKNLTFYFPLATSILISVILSLSFWLWSRR